MLSFLDLLIVSHHLALRHVLFAFQHESLLNRALSLQIIVQNAWLTNRGFLDVLEFAVDNLFIEVLRHAFVVTLNRSFVVFGQIGDWRNRSFWFLQAIFESLQSLLFLLEPFLLCRIEEIL